MDSLTDSDFEILNNEEDDHDDSDDLNDKQSCSSDNEEVLSNSNVDQDDSSDSEEEGTGNADSDESSEEDPGDILLDPSTLQVDDIEEADSMSLDDKIKQLHQQFPKLPKVLIKKMLERDDVNENVGIANGRLKDMDKMEVSSDSQISLSKKKSKKTPQSASNSSCLGDAASCSKKEEPRTKEEKVKYLQDNFKTIAPFIIRKVLDRSDVREDLQLAKKCLTDMAAGKPTVNVGLEQNRGQRGRGGTSNKGRRQCWGNRNQAATSKDEYGNDKVDSYSESGAAEEEETQQEEPKPNKRRNRNRNKNRKKKEANQYENQNQGNWEEPLSGRGFPPQYGPGMPRGNSRGYGNPFFSEYGYGNQMGYPSMQQQPPHLGGPFSYQGVRQPFPGAMRGRGYYYSGQFGQQPFPQNTFGTREDGPRTYRGHRPRSNSGGKGRGRGEQRQGAGKKVQPQNEAVSAASSESSFPRNDQQTEPNTIVLLGLNPNTTFDAIRNFVEARMQEEVLDVAKSDDNKNALITLENIADFDKAKRRVTERCLDGSKLSVELLPVCSSILVCGLSPKTTRDGLEYYFSAPKIGGDVSDIELMEEEGRAIVTFERPEVTQKVVNPSKLHKLDGAPLKVSKHYPLLNSGNKKPAESEGIAIGVEVNIMEFISSSSFIEELKESLKRLGFVLNYKDGEPIAYIAAEPGKEKSAIKQKGIQALTGFLKKFANFSLKVKSHWEAVIADAYQLQHEIGKDKLLLMESKNQDEFYIVCHSSKVEDFKKRFSKQIKETQNCEAKKTYSNQTIDVEEEKLTLLKKIDFIQKYLPKPEYSELEFNLDVENGKVTIIGPKKKCAEAKIKLYQHLAKMSDRQISLSKTIIEMLGSEKGLNRIKQEMEQKSITAVFCVDESEEYDSPKTFVVGISSNDAEKAAELVRGLTSEVKIKVEKENREILQSQEWITLCDELKETMDVHVRTNEFFDTWIAGFKEDVSSAYNKAQRFLEQNSVGTESFICQDKGVRRYLLENKKDELSSIVGTLAQYSVEVKAGEEDNEFSIYGTKTGVDRARNGLKQLVNSVVTKEVEVQQPGLQKFFTRGEGDRLIKSVEQEHRCTIETIASKYSGSSSSNGEVKAVPRHRPLRVAAASSDTSSSEDSDDDDDVAGAYVGVPTSVSGSCITCGTVKISWKSGDIATEQADILVGSVIGQLSRSFHAQKAYQGSLAQGSVAVAPNTNLPNCRHVILTHCSGYQSGNPDQMLRSTVQQCLQQALQLNVTSIAFPILGTAGLGFPRNIASSIMISEVYNVVSGWSGSSCIKDIRFVVFNQDPKLVLAFQQEFSAYSTQASAPAVVSNASNSLFGNIAVNVLSGDLVQFSQTTDAIVNIIAEDMNLQTAGAVSKAIAAAAGSNLQTECFNLGQQSAGAAVVTSGGNLNCNVIHVVPGQANKQQIQTCIENCLQVADNYGFQEISLPALGTGSFGMSEMDSAHATFQAIVNVCPQLRRLKRLQIVIFQPHMVPTFQQVQQQYGLASSNAAISPKRTAPKKTIAPNFKTSTTPKSSPVSRKFLIFGKSYDNVSIAENSLLKGFSEACKSEKIEDENVSKLSQRQRNVLIRRANQLDVNIKFDDKIKRIVVRGDAGDCSAIINDIWKEIQERSKKETDSEQAKVLSQTVRWQYELHGTTKRFSKSTNAAIEKAHVNKDSRVTVKVLDENFVIDLANSTGQGQSSGNQITVSRTTVGAKGGEDISLPKEWRPMPKTNGKEEAVCLVNLSPGSNEYNVVQRQFLNTGGPQSITKIQRIQNPHLYQQYMVMKRKMDQQNSGQNNEKQLFHGTAETNLNDINKSNFNRSFGGRAHGTAYGNGVYFARDASYSVRYAKPSGLSSNRHMYLARVLVGRYTQGNQGLLVPPKDPYSNSNYDSVADSTGSNASIFVVFYDAQCYPEYLITFR